MNKLIKMLVADDHAIVRQGLIQIISDEADMIVEAEAENAAEVLKLCRERSFSVIVLDVSMPPGLSGLDLLPQLKQINPKTPVLILSMYSEEQFAIRALKSGASGYVTKQSAATDLIRAIRKVHSGGKYVSEAFAEQLAFFLSDKGEAPLHEKLSTREFQVLRMIAEGQTLKEIGDHLIISEKTVGTYRMRILEKMNMTRNAALIRYAVKNKLID